MFVDERVATYLGVDLSGKISLMPPVGDSSSADNTNDEPTNANANEGVIEKQADQMDSLPDGETETDNAGGRSLLLLIVGLGFCLVLAVGILLRLRH
jgi:hypothetical protein